MTSVQASSGFRLMIAAALVLALPFAAMAGPPPADKCEAAKNKAAGAYYSCREKAEATAITKATTPNYSKCLLKFQTNWDKAEAAASDACPDTYPLNDPMEAYLTAQATEAASVIAGAPIPPAAVLLRTGQTICWDPADTIDPIAEIPCAGTGQDGELMKGVAHGYTDNGDGTISDDKTGLMWEKLDDSNLGGLAGIHDWDNTYTWADSFVKVSDLNANTFAGYTDWRMPNVAELVSLFDRSTGNPSIDPIFHTGCVPGCTTATCSCTRVNDHNSSTTYTDDPKRAWVVSFIGGSIGASNKTFSYRVRAVRAGS